MSIYALNLFNVKDKAEYLAYAKGAETAIKKYGGKVIALGDLSSAPVGDILPRQVMMLVEWEDKKGIKGYIEDPNLAALHPHREKGVDNFVWHLFERLEDLRPILKDKVETNEQQP